MDPFRLVTVRAAIRSIAVSYAALFVWPVCALPSIATAAPTGAALRPTQRDFQLVMLTVQEHFESLPDYQAGDLLTQSQIDAVLQKLREEGWNVPERERITKLDDFL